MSSGEQLTPAESAAFLDDPRFNRTFELPADPARGRNAPFKMMYVDHGYRNEEQPEKENVLLFFSPLVASRLVHVTKDELAKEHQVRIINVDRPGMGGTDDAEPERRLELWREAIPALLKHLGIQHVAVACHSCGTIYAFDMLVHHPELLHPEKPYFALGAPWVLAQHSGSVALSIIQALPTSVAGTAAGWARLVNAIAPALDSSIGASSALISSLIPASFKAKAPENATRVQNFEDKIWPAVMDRIFAQNVQGISGDAILAAQKTTGTEGWADWGDYDAAVGRIAESFRTSGRKLKVDAFFAETDFMIGNSGAKGHVWFDKCWDAELYGDVIDYKSTTVHGSDHDWVWALHRNAIRQVFEIVGVPVDPQQDAQA